MNILVVAAHPDDEVLGCGGTIARLAQQGRDVYVAILGEGITSRYENRSEADPKLVETLHQQSSKVGEMLGAKEVFTYELPDNRFDTVPLIDVVKTIEDLVTRLEPEAVYTQHGGDLNVDHVVVNRATLTATRPLSSCSVKQLYAYQVFSSTDWAFGLFEPHFRPNVFVDIGDTLETKIRAMQLYETEIRPFPHPRSWESLRANAQRWGSVAGCHAAEAFQLIRSLQ